MVAAHNPEAMRMESGGFDLSGLAGILSELLAALLAAILSFLVGLFV